MGIDISHLDAPDLPEDEQIIEAVAVVKCMDSEGRVSYYHRYSTGLSGPEALGMIHQCRVLMESGIPQHFVPLDPPDDDDEGET